MLPFFAELQGCRPDHHDSMSINTCRYSCLPFETHCCSLSPLCHSTQPLGYSWAGPELDTAVAAHRRQQQQQDDQSTIRLTAKGQLQPPSYGSAVNTIRQEAVAGSSSQIFGQTARQMHGQCAGQTCDQWQLTIALQRPLPAGTLAALLDPSAATIRAALRDYVRVLAPAVPLITIDVKERVPVAAAAAAAAGGVPQGSGWVGANGVVRGALGLAEAAATQAEAGAAVAVSHGETGMGEGEDAEEGEEASLLGRAAAGLGAAATPAERGAGDSAAPEAVIPAPLPAGMTAAAAAARQPRVTVMVEVPPSEWALSEVVHNKWRLRGSGKAQGPEW